MSKIFRELKSKVNNEDGNLEKVAKKLFKENGLKFKYLNVAYTPEVDFEDYKEEIEARPGYKFKNEDPEDLLTKIIRYGGKILNNGTTLEIKLTPFRVGDFIQKFSSQGRLPLSITCISLKIVKICDLGGDHKAQLDDADENDSFMDIGEAQSDDGEDEYIASDDDDEDQDDDGNNSDNRIEYVSDIERLAAIFPETLTQFRFVNEIPFISIL